ncbi:MAG TPA: transposase [Ktedonobacterales bacterium]|nr:transposase [Ktedonobacterales bacterium]
MTNQTTRKSAYPPEFRAEAIQLARTSGKPRTVVAQQLLLYQYGLNHWRIAMIPVGDEPQGFSLR